MDIKKLIEGFEEVEKMFDPMEDETGVNEGMEEEPPKMKKAEYEKIEQKDLGKAKCPKIDEDIDSFNKKLDSADKDLKELIKSLSVAGNVVESLDESIEHDLVCPECGAPDIYNDHKDPHYYHCMNCDNMFHEDEAMEYCEYHGDCDESLNEWIEDEPEEETFGVEYRNMHDGIHRLLVTDSKEKAEQILAYLKEIEHPDTTVYDDNEIADNAQFAWDEINKLADDCFEVDFRQTEEGDGTLDGIKIINHDEVKPDIYESLNEDVVVKFDNGKHEIVKCKEGYFNRYNIKDGKARFTTKCVESLPTAMNALKKRFPKAEEDK